MIRINLLPVKAAQKKEMLKGQLMVALLVLIVTGALCGGAYKFLDGQIQDVQAEIDQKQAEINRLKKIIREVDGFKKRQKELRAKLDVLQKLKDNRTGPVYLLDALLKAMPDKLWLDSFTERGGRAQLKGVGVNEETVALFMRNLDQSDYFDEVDLKVIQQKMEGGVKVQQFDLSCKLILSPEDKQAKAKNGK